MKNPIAARIDLTAEKCEQLAKSYRERYGADPSLMMIFDQEISLRYSDRVEITALRWEK